MAMPQVWHYFYYYFYFYLFFCKLFFGAFGHLFKLKFKNDKSGNHKREGDRRGGDLPVLSPVKSNVSECEKEKKIPKVCPGGEFVIITVMTFMIVF